MVPTVERVLFDGVALLDGDGGRDAVDAVHLRLSMRSKKLAGVGRKGLDVAALALGEESVERKGAFAGTAQTGDDDELVEGQIEVEILEIIVPDAPETDGGRR